ncbi:MAG: hypothetical protein K6G48_04590 [Acholeplasmatales bacterium]|nr:hypothetical protein [Acholeplasmatales bacterium]
MDAKLFNIVSIVNEGFSDKVIEICKENGAGGGTVIPANSGITKDSMLLYGIGVHPEKEIVLVVVKPEYVEPIMSKLYDKLGTGSEAMGIFFTLPVTHASDNLLNQKRLEKEEIK